MAQKKNEKTEKNAAATTKWIDLTPDIARAEAWDWVEDGPVAEGVVVSAELVQTTYEGRARPRVCVVLDAISAEGEAIGHRAVFLPREFEAAARRCVRRLARIEKSGEGKEGTRYRLGVAQG